jgi:ATP-binding cassette subfamily G (WHITE) protein 2 (SNQ2)
MRDNGADCPPSSNPAEYMLDAIGAGSQKRVGDADWADIYLESELFAENKREITALNERSRQEHSDESVITNEYATPFIYQLKVVVRRSFLSFWRMPDYGFTRYVSAMRIV